MVRDWIRTGRSRRRCSCKTWRRERRWNSITSCPRSMVCPWKHVVSFIPICRLHLFEGSPQGPPCKHLEGRWLIWIQWKSPLHLRPSFWTSCLKYWQFLRKSSLIHWKIRAWRQKLDGQTRLGAIRHTSSLWDRPEQLACRWNARSKQWRKEWCEALQVSQLST